MIFIGIAPSDNLESEDAPQRIVQYEFPNDTLLKFEWQRLYWLSSTGVRISHPGLPSTTIAAAYQKRYGPRLVMTAAWASSFWPATSGTIASWPSR